MIAVNPLDSASVLAAFGALGVLAVIFAESGLLVFGFFLPGDTLLFPAGVLCAGLPPIHIRRCRRSAVLRSRWGPQNG